MIIHKEISNFHKKLDVVSCFVEYNGKHLLLQRQPHKTYGGQWGPPAGKVEMGESLAQAMIREILEETGLSLPEEKLDYFKSVNLRHGDFDFEYHMFSTTLSDQLAIKIDPSEHQESVWVSPEEAVQVDLVEDQDKCTRMFYC